MKINNKGFTLVELLAVMVILISISLVAVSTVTNSLIRREEKEKDEQIALAINAAKIYFSMENDGDMCIKIKDLINKNYISDDKKVNVLNVDYVIKLDGDKYVYESGC